MQLFKRRRQNRQEKIQQEIRHALDAIRPVLRIDDCALQLERYDVETGTAVLAANGGCQDCGLSVNTFLQGIETQLRLRVPEVSSVSLAVREQGS